MSLAASDGYTIVRNISGAGRFFAFVGQNGAYLASGADVAVAGSLWDMWSKDTNMIRAMTAALRDGKLAILQAPSAVRFDVSNGNVRSVDISGGSVVAGTPNWHAGSYAGAAPSV